MKKLSQNESLDTLCYRVRSAMNISQAEFAKKIGVSERTVTRWEKKQLRLSNTSSTLLKMLAGKYGVNEPDE